jgi:hypothetical protein
MTLKKRSIYLQTFEVGLFAIIIFLIGYFVKRTDPLLIHNQFSFLILWLGIVTLFYGLAMGLVMWLSFAIMAVMFYINDPYFTTTLLENLAFVFLFGLFFSNLHREMDQYQIQNKYLQLRLKELSSAFFTLKISHDKLESIYITQPASFRFVISEILESCEHNTPELSASNTLKILKKFFGVNSAAIWRIKGDKLHRHFYSIGEIEQDINNNDKLIQEALLQKRAIFLKDIEEKEQTAYIYAVPFLDKREEIVALLIIKDIPFLFYNEDTLLKINVVFNYIWTEYKKRASLDRIRNNKKESIALINHHERQEIVDFKLEVVRLNNILKDFNIESRLFVISTKSQYINNEIKEQLYLNNELEVLDQYITLQCNEQYIHIILFPFLSLASSYDKIEKLQERLNLIEASAQKGETLISKQTSVRNFNRIIEEFDCAK